MQVDLSTVCVLNFWCRLVKLMNDLRVCLIGIENKIITMIYNVFLKYVINVIQYPVLLTFPIILQTCSISKNASVIDSLDYIVIRTVVENKTSSYIKY